MALSRRDIIGAHPIGDALTFFRDAYNSRCEKLGLPRSIDSLAQLSDKDFKNLALDLVLALQSLPASRILPSTTGRGTLLTELSGLVPLVESSEFDAECIVPLLRVVVNKEPDEIIFAKAYAAVTEAAKATPPPRPQVQFLQTPYTHSTSSIVNSSEQRH